MKLIGSHPFDLDAEQRQKTRIGTVFPGHRTLYTEGPGVHAWQRLGFLDRLNEQRERDRLARLSPEEEQHLFAESVDLIFEPECILIRPNPERMDLAFAADDLLQELVSKRQIKFLSVSDPRVREAIKHQGECWRLSGIPKTREAKKRLIFNSKVAIRGEPIYFYNRLTGTRWLTYQEFERLGRLQPESLAAHLQEIAEHSICRNRLGRPEVDFFAADIRHFGARHFSGVAFDKLPVAELRREFERLRDHFGSAVHEAFRKDDCENKGWCDRMLSTLFLQGNETETEHILSGLSPEFFMEVEWLPGGRFEAGEFLFDSIFEEAERNSKEKNLQNLCDPRAKDIIFNLVREYGEIDYINVGRVPESLSLQRPQTSGRRGVYLVELKSRSQPDPIKRFIRLQKWGVWQHLDNGKDLLQSIEESEEYTDYWLDRHLGCRQLRMNLPSRVVMRRLSEIYTGLNPAYQNRIIRTTYFERSYAEGIATDKLPAERYERPGYALELAKLLGKAAAPSLIVGRSMDLGSLPVFDDGDEVVQETPDGLPLQLLVVDHSGAFGEYQSPLETFAAHYARPVNRREIFLPDPREFARIYLNSLRDEFLHIQGDYRKRRRAFDTLFSHCKYDPAGSFAYRWECVLRRLDQANVDAIVGAIQEHIWVLNAGKPLGATLVPSAGSPAR